jgi:peptidoglycan/xylan/chitin deacetylase (PgdA/CDA1 family)
VAPSATWVAPPAQPSPTTPLPEFPSPSPTATASGSAGPSLAAVLAALPHFPPAPPAVPIHFSSGATAPIFYHLAVTAPVAFLTMDDGQVQLSSDLQVMRAAGIPFTMFLIGPVAARNPSFFRQLTADGGVIEDHTMTHPDLKGKPYATQKSEICGARTLLAQTFGGAPTLFRPPYGDYDSNTLRAVHDCGLLSAFDWSETVDQGKVYYQTSVHRINRGDIILMHFRPAFAQDVLAALEAIHSAGLTPALLENYFPPSA